MNNRLLASFGIAVVVVLAVIAGTFYVQRGSHVVLDGKILKVRLAPLDENSSVAVVDFRFTNVANYPFSVRSVTVVLEDSAGKRTEGGTIADVDAQRLFQALPLLGQKYNASLLVRDEVAAHASEDRMVAARFELPESQLEARKQLSVRVENVNEVISEIKEK